MGIETEADLGGSEMTFTAALIAIEELAKVDPSISAMVDIHVRNFLGTFIGNGRGNCIYR